MFEIILLIVVVAMPAIILHEVAHGWAANLLGDPTAKDQGRLTLNPLSHVDPVGTVVLPLILFLLKSPFIFGFAKPVPFDPGRLHHPRRDIMLVRLAGPVTNILIAFICAKVAIVLGQGVIAHYLVWAVVVNLGLALFNLIPIPPLDGSGIWYAILPDQLLRWVVKIDNMMGIVIVFVLLQLGVFDFIGKFIGVGMRMFGL